MAECSLARAPLRQTCDALSSGPWCRCPKLWRWSMEGSGADQGSSCCILSQVHGSRDRCGQRQPYHGGGTRGAEDGAGSCTHAPRILPRIHPRLPAPHGALFLAVSVPGVLIARPIPFRSVALFGLRQVLIGAGAHVNAPCRSGNTALMYAAKLGTLATCKVSMGPGPCRCSAGNAGSRGGSGFPVTYSRCVSATS